MYINPGAGNTSQIEQRLEEVRALLAQRREQLPLWHAYGLQLYKAGQAKVGATLLCCGTLSLQLMHAFSNDYV